MLGMDLIVIYIILPAVEPLQTDDMKYLPSLINFEF